MPTKLFHSMISVRFNIIILIFVIYLPPDYSIKSFKTFTSLILRSDKILILNEYGIYTYDQNLDTENALIEFETQQLSSLSDLKYASIAEFDSSNYFIICRLLNNIYLINNENNDNNLIFSTTLDQKFLRIKISLIPYKYETDISNNNNIYFIISYISKNGLCIDEYKIIDNTSINLMSSIIDDSIISLIENISCQIMKTNSNKEILFCFYQQNVENFPLIFSIFDPDNNFNKISNYTIYGLKAKTYSIKSVMNKQKSKSLNCLVSEKGEVYCILFNSFENSYSDLVYIYDKCIADPDSFRIIYTNENEETSFSCNIDNQRVEMIIFDKNYNIKSNNEEYSNCYYISNYKNCLDVGTYDLVYLNQKSNYFFLNTCQDSGNFILLNDSYGICNTKIDEIYFNNSSPSDSNFTSNITNSTSDFNYSVPKEASNYNYFPLPKFYQEDDIFKAKIDIKKEEIIKNLTGIINGIDIDKKYQIIGDDYNIKISPITQQFTSKVNFTECENILKRENIIPENSKLNILKIEISQENAQVLNNKIEYLIFDENKNIIDLSKCKDTKIQIHYEIENSTSLNTSLISYFYEQGIDIFNINDTFFNDICYPFSNNKSDMILKDRISDIYQNYSLCEKSCTYDHIEIFLNEIICECPVKQEVNIQTEEPEFVDMLKMTFKNSNIAVIKCYKLIFNLKNKSNNFGFWLFLILIIGQIITVIYFLINRLNPITKFIRNEMIKNNYTVTKSKNESNPSKKKKQKNKVNKEPTMQMYQMDNRNENPKYVEINSISINNSKNVIIDKKNRKRSSNLINSKRLSSRSRKKTKTNEEIFPNKNQESCIKNKTIWKEIKNKKKKKSLVTKNYNENNKCPGYYHLILINAKNLSKINSNNANYVLNIYTFEEAKKKDARNFWRILWICLLNNEKILKTFIFKSLIELKSLKIISFIFTYSFYLSLNALFYGNDKISDNYHYNGDYLYLYALINDLVTSVISGVAGIILILLNNLIHSRYEFEEVFRVQENKMKKTKKYEVNREQIEKINIQINKITEKLKIKIIIFLSFIFIFMLFFIYFITAFCAVYQETQVSWILNAIVSFIVSVIIECILAFFNAILYDSALKYKIEFLFKISIFVYKYT